MKEDKREIFRAAADAQKIADMELGFHPDFARKMRADAATPDSDEAPAPAAIARSNATSYRRAAP